MWFVYLTHRAGPQDAGSERLAAHVPLLRGVCPHQPVPVHERHPGRHLQQLQETPQGNDRRLVS